MNENSKPVRVWVDGCFDMLHFGHANALRQAKSLGDTLIVGIHSDEEIELNKGSPVFTLEERLKMLESIKWVDEIVSKAPYYTTLETLQKYNCDFCAHGDDITVGCDGRDTYYKVKEAHKFKEFKRTNGVSTTNLVKRMLKACGVIKEKINGNNDDVSSYTTGSNFYPNTLLISHFQNDLRDATSSDTIIYVPGSFDLFHVGHCMFLEKCKELGNYIVVGLYSDEAVKSLKGDTYPVMSFHERLLSVLSCKFVSNVILCPPLNITELMINTLNISKVAHGEVENEGLEDYFKIAESLNKLEIINSGCSTTFRDILEKIKANQHLYINRNKVKEAKEKNYVETDVINTTSN